MSTKSHRMCLLALVALVSSCANVSVRRLQPEERTNFEAGGKPRGPDEGVRCWRSHPYVLIRKEGAANALPTYSAQIVQLPDPEQEYLITWSPGLGSVKPSFALSDGWNLTGFSSEVASGASSILSSVAQLASAADGIRFFEEGTKLEPGLYKLIWDAKQQSWGIDPKNPAIKFPLVVVGAPPKNG